MGLTFISLLVAAVTKSGDAILFQVVCDLLLGGYLALLVRIRNLATERDLNMAYSTRSGLAPQAAPARREVRPPRRRQEPSRYETGGYDLGGYEVASGYGELALRRAAN